jgi:hypothetical protein
MMTLLVIGTGAPVRVPANGALSPAMQSARPSRGTRLRLAGPEGGLDLVVADGIGCPIALVDHRTMTVTAMSSEGAPHAGLFLRQGGLPTALILARPVFNAR